MRSLTADRGNRFCSTDSLGRSGWHFGSVLGRRGAREEKRFRGRGGESRCRSPHDTAAAS